MEKLRLGTVKRAYEKLLASVQHSYLQQKTPTVLEMPVPWVWLQRPAAVVESSRLEPGRQAGVLQKAGVESDPRPLAEAGRSQAHPGNGTGRYLYVRSLVLLSFDC